MRGPRKAVSGSSQSGIESAPEKYFDLPMTILLLTGMYPISSERGIFPRLLYYVYFWLLYLFIAVLNPVSKAIALSYQTNLDDFTGNLSYVINHTMGVFKIALFMIKRKDLMRLIETMEGPRFRHEECNGGTFSPNRLIREAVRNSRAMYFVYLFCVVGMISNSILNAIMQEVTEELLPASNGTEFEKASLRRHRALPFHGWFPFSTQVSPNYELAFVYQIVAIFIPSQMITALDSLVFSFMMHIKVQFQILSHNLRSVESHATNRRGNISASAATVAAYRTVSRGAEADRLKEAMETDLERNIAHHRAIIEVSRDLESVFTYQLLVQFMCSMLAICTLMWQVSSTPVLSAKFASMLSHLMATAIQLFIYCWFGNELMMESSSVADAAWDSKWHGILSRRYSHGVSMIIHRSQKVVIITAGGFVDLTLETFMTIFQAAYSYFAVLKKMDG